MQYLSKKGKLYCNKKAHSTRIYSLYLVFFFLSFLFLGRLLISAHSLTHSTLLETNFSNGLQMVLTSPEE